MSDRIPTHPTPISGMPAQVAATSIARPSLGAGEISAPKSEATIAILTAVNDLRSEVTRRFEAVETRQDQQATTLQRLANEVTENAKNMAEQAAALTRVSSSAAVASELAAKAMARSSSAQDDTQKMVESAMTIQKGAIAAAVTEALAPVITEVHALKTSYKHLEKNDETQNATLLQQNTALAELGTGVKTLLKLATSPRVAAYVAIGAMLGGAVMSIADKLMK